MRKYLVLVAITASVMTANAFATNDNYCLTGLFKKDLLKSEKRFSQKHVNIKNTQLQFNVKETANSPGGPQFKCSGKVNVISKSTNTSILSYDIAYDAMMDEGYGGVTKISRKNISK